MSNEITIVAPKTLDESERLSATLAKSTLLPEALRNKPGDVLATLLTGAELGLAPMQAVRGIVIIKGKPSLSADLMGALVKRRKDVCEYLVLTESTSTKATYRTKRVGDPEPTTISFTIDDAKAAGLVSSGGMYTKYPSQMLRARCLSGICRAVYPDLCMGLYDPEELGAANTDAPANVLPPPERDVTPAESQPPRASRTAALKERIQGKSRAQVVDVAPDETEEQAEQRAGAEVPPAAPSATLPVAVAFGPHAGKPVISLSSDEIAQCLAYAEENAAKLKKMAVAQRRVIELNIEAIKTEQLDRLSQLEQEMGSNG